jgi:hypothetical protein
MAVRSGKIPTTSVRRRISLFNRSWGLLDQIWRQISFGNAVNASRSARAVSRCAATRGSFSARASSVRSYCAIAFGAVAFVGVLVCILRVGRGHDNGLHRVLG